MKLILITMLFVINSFTYDLVNECYKDCDKGYEYCLREFAEDDFYIEFCEQSLRACYSNCKKY